MSSGIAGTSGVLQGVPGRPAGSDAAEAGRLGDAERGVQLALAGDELLGLGQVAVSRLEVALPDLAELGPDRAPGLTKSGLGETDVATQPALASFEAGSRQRWQTIAKNARSTPSVKRHRAAAASVGDTADSAPRLALAPPRRLEVAPPAVGFCLC
jgi:hypothetical protein